MSKQYDNKGSNNIPIPTPTKLTEEPKSPDVIEKVEEKKEEVKTEVKPTSTMTKVETVETTSTVDRSLSHVDKELYDSFTALINQNKTAVGPDEITAVARSIFKQLMAVLTSSNQAVFDKKWASILLAVHKNSKNFNYANALRCGYNWNLGTENYKAFSMLITVIIRSADPGKRSEMNKFLNPVVIDNSLPAAYRKYSAYLVNFYNL